MAEEEEKIQRAVDDKWTTRGKPEVIGQAHLDEQTASDPVIGCGAPPGLMAQ